MPLIFGIGLSRTGGTSLAAALRRLGYKTIHWPFLMIDANMNLRYSMVEKYDALLDMPFVLNYKELDKKYPDAQFILTVRENRQAWLESMYRLHAHQRWFVAWLPNVLAMDRAFWGKISYDATNLSRKYDAYLEDVKKHFSGRENKLLVLDVTRGEGYKKLCPFLGKKVLSEKFPHKNKGYHTILKNTLRKTS